MDEQRKAMKETFEEMNIAPTTLPMREGLQIKAPPITAASTNHQFITPGPHNILSQDKRQLRTPAKSDFFNEAKKK